MKPTVRPGARYGRRRGSPPQRRVERRERLVGHERVFSAEPEPAGSAATTCRRWCSRPAQRTGRPRAARRCAAFAAGAPRPGAQQRDALLDLAPVDFELGFAGAARADAAAQARESAPTPIKFRLAVAQLRQFDLQLAFARARVQGEDSRISIVRSTIGSGTIFSRLVRWRGRRSLNTNSVSAPSSVARSAISRALPLPTSVAGSTCGSFCTTSPTMIAPAALASATSSSSSGRSGRSGSCRSTATTSPRWGPLVVG